MFRLLIRPVPALTLSGAPFGSINPLVSGLPQLDRLDQSSVWEEDANTDPPQLLSDNIKTITFFVVLRALLLLVWDNMNAIRLCLYYDMETTITISSGKSGFTFRITRCHQFANLGMYTGEPEIYRPESCPEMSPGILAPQDNLVLALEDFLLDIGVVPLFFRSIIPVIARAIPWPSTLQLSIDVTLYLFSLVEDCSDLDKQKLPPSWVGPCSIFLDNIHGDAESNTTTLPCFHLFHTHSA